MRFSIFPFNFGMRKSYLPMLIWILSIIAGLYVLFSLIIYMGQEKVIFFPQKLEKDASFDFPGNWEELSIKSGDHALLHALHFKADKPKGVVLYLHGNAGNVSNWGVMASALVERGFNCLVPDYRGYGKSTGKISEQGLYEDAEACYEYLKNYYPDSEIIVCGRSLGTGISAWLAANKQPAKLLLETPYYSFTDMAELHFRFFPVNWLLRYHFRTGDWMDEIACPVVAVHGTQDELIPVQQSKKLQKHFGSKDTLILVNGAHHNDLQEYPAYDRYLNEHLSL